jgi:hypothetical protein
MPIIVKDTINKNSFVPLSGLLYTLTVLVVVLSAWIADLHRYDLGLTTSKYVALRPWTAVLYMIIALPMVALVFLYIKKTKMPLLKKIVYYVIILGVLGCAIFPSNRQWSVSASVVHNVFANGLMLMATASFIIMLITSKVKKLKTFSALAICYAAVFIVSFEVGFELFDMTLFIWENVFIYLLLIELSLEKQND